jgi:hypothetical protein
MKTSKTKKTALNKKIPLRPLTPKILIDHRTGKVPVWASQKEKTGNDFHLRKRKRLLYSLPQGLPRPEHLFPDGSGS